MQASSSKRRGAMCAVSSVLVAVSAMAAARAEEVAAPRGPEPQASIEVVDRAERIDRARARIENELAAHGGTWDAWYEDLEPYRHDIWNYATNYVTYEWPWPAKDDHRFHGALVYLHLRKTFDDLPDGHRPYDQILQLDRQLKHLGIDLMVAIIPGGLSIYPDYLYAGVPGENRPVRAPEDRVVSLAVRQLQYRLLTNDVEVVDLHGAFADFRREHDDVMLFYKADAHYNNLGARVAAAAIAEHLMRYDFVQEAVADNPYFGVPAARHDGRKADSNLLEIRHKGGWRYRPKATSSILLMGDSHFGYNNKLGAFATAQVARFIGMPVAQIWQEGLAAQVPVRLVVDPFLKNRKVVVLNYSERMMNPGGKPGQIWPMPRLPGAREVGLAKTRPVVPDISGFPAGCVVEAVSDRPDPKAPYKHFIMKLYVKKLGGFLGKVGTGEGVVHVLAMHNRKVLPVAQVKKGDQLKFSLTSWRLVEKQYGSLQAGSLDDVQLELLQPLYWAEMAGAPKLTEGDLTDSKETPE